MEWSERAGGVNGGCRYTLWEYLTLWVIWCRDGWVGIRREVCELFILGRDQFVEKLDAAQVTFDGPDLEALYPIEVIERRENSGNSRL